jgi:hypothetical protein
VSDPGDARLQRSLLNLLVDVFLPEYPIAPQARLCAALFFQNINPANTTS